MLEGKAEELLDKYTACKHNNENLKRKICLQCMQTEMQKKEIEKMNSITMTGHGLRQGFNKNTMYMQNMRK